MNEKDFEFFQKTAAELKKLIDIFPSLSVVKNNALQWLFDSTWGEFRLNYEQLKPLYFVRERSRLG